MEKNLITITRSERLALYKRKKERTRLVLKVSKLLKTLVLICCLSTIVAAQDKVDTVMMRKIRNEEKQNSKLNYLAHQLMEVCGPRLTNSPGFARAVNWTISEMKGWGLQARVEPWDKDFGRGWSAEQVYVAMKTPYYQPIIAYPKAWSKGTGGLVRGPLMLLNKLDSATIIALGKKLSGKIVLLENDAVTIPAAFNPEAGRLAVKDLNQLPDAYMQPSNTSPAAVAAEARQVALYRLLESQGALGVLSMGRKSRDGTVFVGGTYGYKMIYEKPMPQVAIASEHYFQMRRLITEGTPVTVELNIQNQWDEHNLKGYNVVAEMPGTDPLLKTEVVMLGGHLDSWHTGTGATDNGAGCIVMMEAVRILRSLGVQPRRTIRIALWGGEEQGELGSASYVRRHFVDASGSMLPEQSKISVYFNLDNGTGKIRGIYLQNNHAAGEIFKNWLAPFADLGATGLTESNTGATDHIEFDTAGIPGFQFIQDPLEYEEKTHHSNMDVYDHLAFEDLRQAAIVVAGFIYNAAMRDDMIPRKPTLK